MSFTGLDAVTDLDTTLTSGWNAANTDSLTPLITDNLQTPWENLDFGAKDHIYVKFNAEPIKTGLYATAFYHDIACTIEVMTARFGSTQAGLAHFNKLIKEAVRIVKANPRLSPYVYMVVRSIGNTRFNKERGIFTATIEIDFKKVTTS